MTNNLFHRFEALWPKILPLDLKRSVYFFYSPCSHFLDPLTQSNDYVMFEWSLRVHLSKKVHIIELDLD